jgi:hypothetical protein
MDTSVVAYRLDEIGSIGRLEENSGFIDPRLIVGEITPLSGVRATEVGD